MDNHIFIILKEYYNKNNKLPEDGRLLVATNVIKKGDLVDYVLKTTEKIVKINYTYYENSKNEKKFISSSFCLTKK